MPSTETAPTKPSAAARLAEFVRTTFVNAGQAVLDDDPTPDELVDVVIKLLREHHPELAEAQGEETDAQRDWGRVDGWKAAVKWVRGQAGEAFSENRDGAAAAIRLLAERMDRNDFVSTFEESASKHIKTRDRIRREVLGEESQ